MICVYKITLGSWILLTTLATDTFYSKMCSNNISIVVQYCNMTYGSVHINTLTALYYCGNCGSCRHCATRLCYENVTHCSLNFMAPDFMVEIFDVKRFQALYCLKCLIPHYLCISQTYMACHLDRQDDCCQNVIEALSSSMIFITYSEINYIPSQCQYLTNLNRS